MQTFLARRRHPAPQPMGAPGRGAPRGGGGVRRGRRRDVCFGRFPASLYFIRSNLDFSGKSPCFSVQKSLKSAKISIKRSVVDACSD